MKTDMEDLVDVMKTDTEDLAGVVGAFGVLRRELARLGERVAKLEAASLAAPRAVAAPAAPPAAGPAPLSDETVLVLSAAIAAFLGKKARIRQIRLLGSAAWSQQGRVTIQASHVIPLGHG
jgi:methylmalonyl-CoA carboxyltransferase 12S subunit